MQAETRVQMNHSKYHRDYTPGLHTWITQLRSRDSPEHFSLVQVGEQKVQMLVPQATVVQVQF